MNYVYAILLALVGAIAFYFKKKAEKSDVDAIQAAVKGEDKGLVEQYEAKKAELDQVNENIRKLREDRARNQNEVLSDQQRSDKWNK